MLEAESVWLNSSHSSFVLRGFPALQQWRPLLAVALAALYFLVLLGNSALVFVIGSVAALHSPMNLLVLALCVVDMLVVSAIVPNMLLGFLLGNDYISLRGCLTQMFFTHFLSSLESTLLLVMALDRYVAVCLPLRYNRVMGGATARLLLLFTLLRSGSVMATLVALAASHSFCGSNVIQHCYCDHMALVSLACDSRARSSAAGVAVIACFVGVDIPLIFFSYVKILRVVLRAVAGEDCWKAFHTCGTHLIIMMCFYLVGSVAFLSHNLNLPVSTDINSFMGLMYILFPATVNPIIYGVRTKEIRNSFLKIFKSRVKALTVKVSPAGKESK